MSYNARARAVRRGAHDLTMPRSELSNEGFLRSSSTTGALAARTARCAACCDAAAERPSLEKASVRLAAVAPWYRVRRRHKLLHVLNGRRRGEPIALALQLLALPRLDRRRVVGELRP